MICLQVLERDTTFAGAVRRLSTTDTAADAYFIVAGVRPGEGAVVTKARLHVDDVWYLKQTKDKFVLSQYHFLFHARLLPTKGMSTSLHSKLKIIIKARLNLKLFIYYFNFIFTHALTFKLKTHSRPPSYRRWWWLRKLNIMLMCDT